MQVPMTAANECVVECQETLYCFQACVLLQAALDFFKQGMCQDMGSPHVDTTKLHGTKVQLVLSRNWFLTRLSELPVNHLLEQGIGCSPVYCGAAQISLQLAPLLRQGTESACVVFPFRLSCS